MESKDSHGDRKEKEGERGSKGRSVEDDEEVIEVKRDDIDNDGVGEIRSSDNIITKFCQFAYRIISQEMDDWFEDHLDSFEQNDDDLTSGRGETFEQYDVYQKYLKKLEVYFDDFASEEGFSNSSDCFDAINDLIIDDKEARKKMLKDLADKLREAHEKYQDQIADASEEKAEAKAEHKQLKDSGSKNIDKYKGEEKENADSDEVEVAPMIMFFTPISMESMMQQVLTLTDYQTFSFIMRQKVRQAHLLKSMKRNVAKHESESLERKELLAHPTAKRLSKIYTNLIDRICGLTPHQDELHATTRNMMNASEWDQVISEENASHTDKMNFKKLVMSCCMTLWQLCSPEQRSVIRFQLSAFIPQVDNTQGDLRGMAVLFLNIAHEIVNAIETQMVEALEALHKNRKKSKHTTRETK